MEQCFLRKRVNMSISQMPPPHSTCDLNERKHAKFCNFLPRQLKPSVARNLWESRASEQMVHGRFER